MKEMEYSTRKGVVYTFQTSFSKPPLELLRESTFPSLSTKLSKDVVKCFSPARWEPIPPKTYQILKYQLEAVNLGVIRSHEISWRPNSNRLRISKLIYGISDEYNLRIFLRCAKVIFLYKEYQTPYNILRDLIDLTGRNSNVWGTKGTLYGFDRQQVFFYGRPRRELRQLVVLCHFNAPMKGDI